MATKYNIRENQCLLDAALIIAGTAESVVELAMKNGLSITEKLPPYTPIDKIEVQHQPMFSYYKENKLTPATDASYEELFIQEGIDFWAILDEFQIQ